MFDINGQEFVILLLVVGAVVGPNRLPLYSREIRLWGAKARDLLADTRAAVRDEMGDTVDFGALEPHRFDPVHAATDVATESSAGSPVPRSEGRAARRRSARGASEGTPPFDADAT